MAGHQTETNKEYKEMGEASIPDQDLDLGDEREQETLAKSQDSEEVVQGEDKLHEGEVEIKNTMSINSQTDVEKLDGPRFTNKEHEEPKEQEHLLKREKADQSDTEQREEAPEGESALIERSPEAHKSHIEASQSHEAHTDVMNSTLQDGEASKEAARNVLGEHFLPLSANNLTVADCELEQLASRSPTTDKNEQERRNEVFEPSMSHRET